MNSPEIPIAQLETHLNKNGQPYSESILENEIEGIYVEHVAVAGEDVITDYARENFKVIYLFVKGMGTITAEEIDYEIVPETIFLPNIVEKVTIQATSEDPLHYVKISAELTDQDRIDLQEFPANNTQNVYYAKFTDCQSYTEKIKSPNTVSRTILSNKYIPRIAMGTVQTKGPDEVGAHEHPMLEQLFLGLAENNCTVYADDATAAFSQYAVLHVPLGSMHSVSVEKDEILYYVWMDFFLDKKGEEWLKTHKVNEDDS